VVARTPALSVVVMGGGHGGGADDDGANDEATDDDAPSDDDDDDDGNGMTNSDVDGVAPSSMLAKKVACLQLSAKAYKVGRCATDVRAATAQIEISQSRCIAKCAEIIAKEPDTCHGPDHTMESV
jgi:hypothetical protein